MSLSTSQDYEEKSSQSSESSESVSDTDLPDGLEITGEEILSLIQQILILLESEMNVICGMRGEMGLRRDTQVVAKKIAKRCIPTFIKYLKKLILLLQ